MAYVFKRDGSWVIKWLDGAGRYRQKRTTCKTRLEAKALAHQIAIKAEYQRVGLEPIEGPSRITFSELLDWHWKNFGELLRSKGSKFPSVR
jgi:integrase